MSHSKERKEKNCLNCGAEVAGRYCQVCGQENLELKESFGHLVTHFFNDITHFDGKFFNSARYLITRPGKLTDEYTSGRRVRYLNPIRMYVFTSAFFFLMFFSFISHGDEGKKQGLAKMTEELAVKQADLMQFDKMAGLTTDPVMLKAIVANQQRTRWQIDSLLARMPKQISSGDTSLTGTVISQIGNDSVANEIKDRLLAVTEENDTVPIANRISFGKGDFLDFDFYRKKSIYEAIQHELPDNRKDGLVSGAVKAKLLNWYDQQKARGTIEMRAVMDRLMHYFPSMLFISLPIFAFFLKLLYLRRKQFYYADHGIFAIHTYCALFILLLLYYLFDAMHASWHVWLLNIIKKAIGLYMIIYVYKAMRYYYGQSRKKTLAKYVVLSFFTFTTMLFLISVFFVVAALKN